MIKVSLWHEQIWQMLHTVAVGHLHDEAWAIQSDLESQSAQAILVAHQPSVQGAQVEEIFVSGLI